PVVSVHVAASNESRVIERWLDARAQLEYPEYEVVVVDASTDESVQILEGWRNQPRFKILHRTSRTGYKGGALSEALKVMDPRAEYVVVFDADSVPFADSIERLLPLFYRVSDGTSIRRFEAAFGRIEPPSEPGKVKRRAEVAAVQSYQWHVLTKLARLARQRMRWAEGHTHNVRKWFLPIMGSPLVTPIEKLEFVYDSTYYLQAALFVAGSISWLISELVFRTHVPGWTALLGWSLIFSNVFALPLMNLGGLILEEAPLRDVQGVFGALVLSFALVPFQGWAALKGLISKDEGPWFRTPKTGHVTDQVRHLRRLYLLRRWLRGRRPSEQRWSAPAARLPASPTARPMARRRWLGWLIVGLLGLMLGGLALASTHAPVVSAAGNPLYLHGTGTAPG